jgi:hypothetical protein
MRTHLYRGFVGAEYGVLGARNRVRIPECVVAYIQSLCPSEDGTYKGYSNTPTKHQTGGIAEEEEDNEGFDNQNESMNTSYEDVEDEETQTPADFGGGEKMELAVQFHNKKLNADHIRSFVLESPIVGWNVNFRQDPFSSARQSCAISKRHMTKWLCIS